MVILNILQPTPNSWNIYFVYEKTFFCLWEKQQCLIWKKKKKKKNHLIQLINEIIIFHISGIAITIVF